MSRTAFILLSALLPAILSTDVNNNLEQHSRSKRLAIHPSQWSTHLWPGGVVPYEIAPHYDNWERNVILSGMAEFPKHTCITFRPRHAGDRYYLTINKYYNLERCFSYIGRQTTHLFRTPEGNVETRMRLDPSCLRFNGRGTVMHELMHIIGFYHEHQRDDRDPRISGSPTHYNFKIYPRWSTYYMGKYDPTSIMHYNFPGIVYPRTYFSVSDILRINTLYRCPQKAAGVSTTQYTPSPTSRPTWTTQRTWPTTSTTTTSWTTQRWAPPATTTAAPAWPTTRRYVPWATTTTTWAPQWPSRTTNSAVPTARRLPERPNTTTTWTPQWPSKATKNPNTTTRGFTQGPSATTAWAPWWATKKPDQTTTRGFTQGPTGTTAWAPQWPSRSTTEMPVEEDEQLSRNGILRKFRV